MKGDAFVLDTNVLISAALSAESAPSKVTIWVIAHARLIDLKSRPGHARAAVGAVKRTPAQSKPGGRQMKSCVS